MGNAAGLRRENELWLWQSPTLEKCFAPVCYKVHGMVRDVRRVVCSAQTSDGGNLNDSRGLESK